MTTFVYRSQLRSPLLSRGPCHSAERHPNRRARCVAHVAHEPTDILSPRAPSRDLCWRCLAWDVSHAPHPVALRPPAERIHERFRSRRVRVAWTAPWDWHTPRCASPYHDPRRPARAAVRVLATSDEAVEAGLRCWACVALTWVNWLHPPDLSPVLRLTAAHNPEDTDL